MASFKLGINMAGAISAGAYTAGVLDFLTEALDEWCKAKAAGAPVPPHDVSIEVISGASAGGMCAAISSVLLQEEFEHIRDVNRTGTSNRFYESWVNRIDIRELLKTGDLAKNPQLISLLDSSIIDDIANYALAPASPLPAPRKYVSPNLTLYLSLTNLRGTPYSLNGVAPGSLEESTFFFGDRIRFETLRTDKTAPPSTSAHTLDIQKPGTPGGWNILRTAAMGTGAFPLFLAPRILQRTVSEYTPPLWESVASATTGTPPPISPNFPPGTPDPLSTLNVDGGVTNNDPFNYAHDHLALLQPPLLNSRAAVAAKDADRAVISIAPFPTMGKFDPTYDPLKNITIFPVLGKLISALISQSRFFGESLDQVMNGATFSRFVIAPSDNALAERYRQNPSQEQPPALQCAALGAFGGFFLRGFRAHDYALGRRNCQRFLSESFVLPEDNVVMKAALDGMDPAARDKVVEAFQRPAPGTYAQGPEALQQAGRALPRAQATRTGVWIPIIPLCSPSVTAPIPRVERAVMTGETLDQVVTVIMGRFKAVIALLIAGIPSWKLRFFLTIGQPFIRFLASRPLRDAIGKQLGDSFRER